MKPLVVSILILLAAFFILTRSFAAEQQEQPKSTEASPATTGAAPASWRTEHKYDKLPGDLKFLQDPNAIQAKIKEYEGLEKAFEKVIFESRHEIREWKDLSRSSAARREYSDRAGLARDIQEQAILELALIRLLAIEEEAPKTTAAVERLMLEKQQRYQGIQDTLREIARELRRSERREKGSRPSKTVRDRGAER